MYRIHVMQIALKNEVLWNMEGGVTYERLKWELDVDFVASEVNSGKTANTLCSKLDDVTMIWCRYDLLDVCTVSISSFPILPPF